MLWLEDPIQIRTRLHLTEMALVTVTASGTLMVKFVATATTDNRPSAQQYRNTLISPVACKYDTIPRLDTFIDLNLILILYSFRFALSG